MHEIGNVTIVGAGTMGHSLAQVFAQAGCQVWLNDVKEEILAKAKSLIASNLKTLVELELLTEKGRDCRREPHSHDLEDRRGQPGGGFCH